MEEGRREGGKEERKVVGKGRSKVEGGRRERVAGGRDGGWEERNNNKTIIKSLGGWGEGCGGSK